ncbi:MAG: monovalent cation/H+ antiporter subunit D family protein [Chromatiaceae bacterium]|nr:monovalent cation/H+ antiporter subunit D family protein [Gammaproteobacteria bacterium]MCP5304534.1 monovalent cation/H+ antiporter subunit D family protein [Chromatiaceae bacterium]MCP5314262.1 monovalent cation/H+ antiporter subunit D family protein [Chromatiaceae bacterium]
MTLIDHLPVLAVVLPLLGAPLCVLIDRPGPAWLVALVSTWLGFIAAVALLVQVVDGGPVSYHLSGWAPPWGIEYHVDLLGAYVLLVVTAIAALVMTFARESVQSEIAERLIARFYATLLLVVAGLAGITVTGDAFNLFVFLEISSLASYAAISMGRDRRALSAAFQYLVMGTIGATFILIGIGLLYMMTGTLNMLDLAERLPSVTDTRTVRAGFAFLTVGLGLKLALFPLHLWLPNAYAHAPSTVSALLAGTATKVAVYALLRFMLEVFGAEFALQRMPFDDILMVLGMIGIFSASLVAVYQDDIRRMFAYSSVAQIGYMVLGIGLTSTLGVSAAILHLFNHALMKGALFLALGAIVYRIGRVTLGDFAGLGRRMPWTMAAVVLGGFSLIGIPPSVGFVSKWYLVLATMEQGLWPVALLILAGTLLALVYVWKLIEAAYFGEPAAEAPPVREAPLSMLLPIWFLVATNFYFGIFTEVSAGVATRAATALLGGGG